MPTTTQTPGFEFLFAMIGVVAAMCLVGRRRIATSDEEITCLKIADKNRKMYMG
jgi:PGF-CTERM protein